MSLEESPPAMPIINNKGAFQEASEKKVYFPQVEDNFEKTCS